jgi:hypothetical protein
MCAAEQTGIRAVKIISAHGESKAQFRCTTDIRLAVFHIMTEKRRNTMRMIDADALLNALNTYSDTENGNGHFLHGIKSAQEQIDDAPTIDAMPVVRGEWIENPVSNKEAQ